MNRSGWPSGVAALTGTMATPMPWVKVIRWLTHELARGFFSGASSRPASITWRALPLIG